jgi:hypothetical protein
MVRLPTRGSSIATPVREQTELGACLTDLGVGDHFDEEGLVPPCGLPAPIRWRSFRSHHPMNLYSRVRRRQGEAG